VVLAVVLAVTSVISLYYYFRVVYHMFLKEGAPNLPAPSAGRPLGWSLALCGVAVLVIGLYGQPFLHWASQAVLLGR
jgi:NADH:ubiquinone oxidoreductase subunit 2 (subunit N)